jgi:hypothetical protein
VCRQFIGENICYAQLFLFALKQSYNSFKNLALQYLTFLLSMNHIFLFFFVLEVEVARWEGRVGTYDNSKFHHGYYDGAFWI